MACGQSVKRSNVLTMEIRTVSRSTCPLCGSIGDILHSNMQDRMSTVPGNWPLRRCLNADCGLGWLDPSPVESDIPLFYLNYFTHERDDSKQKFLERAYSITYAGYRIATRIPSALLGLNKAREQMLHMFLDDADPGRLLDVGCGNGDFLHRMYKRGWSVTGIDFDAKAIENAKKRAGEGSIFLNTDLSGARFPDNSFDAITMSHVIEHVPDPVALLTEVRRILKTPGQLVITTPNLQSFGHQKFQDCWAGLDAPRHLQIFSLPALQMCARKAGFTTMKASTSAANGDGLFGISFGFEEAKAKVDFKYEMKAQFNFIRGLRSLLLQYQEAWRLRHNPECGEETVLICQK
jgi:2-polyprenyl-3-methyl-5-hydroxy-6-metoxy-1,4-benzoquinol methylase